MPSGVKTELLLATSSDVVSKLLGYVVLATLARALSKADMGELFFAIAFASIFAMLTELGTHRYLVRKVAQNRTRALDHLSEVLSLRLPAIGAAFLLMNGFALIFMRERAQVLLLASIFVLIGDLYYTFGSLFLGLRRIGYRFVTGLIDPVLLVLLVLVAVSVGWNLYAVLVCYIVAKVTLVAVTAVVVRWRFGQFGLVFDASRLRRVTAESLPFFLLGFLGLVFLKVDILMILFFRSAEEVARYEAGYKFLEISRFAVRSAGMVFFPLCTQLVARRNWTALAQLAERLLLAAAGVGTALAVGVIALASVLVPFVWGAAYETSIPVLRALFLGLPFLYLSFVSTFLAQSLRLEHTVVRIMIVSTLGNVLLNAAIIPRWGALGAAWTTVASEVGLAAWLVWFVMREIRGLRREGAAG